MPTLSRAQSALRPSNQPTPGRSHQLRSSRGKSRSQQAGLLSGWNWGRRGDPVLGLPPDLAGPPPWDHFLPIPRNAQGIPRQAVRDPCRWGTCFLLLLLGPHPNTHLTQRGPLVPSKFRGRFLGVPAMAAWGVACRQDCRQPRLCPLVCVRCCAPTHKLTPTQRIEIPSVSGGTPFLTPPAGRGNFHIISVTIISFQLSV